MLSDKSMFHCYLGGATLLGWQIFFPFYGPGLRWISFNILDTGHFFILGILPGLLCSGWFYCSRYNKGRIICIEKIFPPLIFISTLLMVAVRPLPASYFFIICMLIQGYSAGWLLIRLVTCMSGAGTVRNRGMVIGRIMAVSIVLVFVYIGISGKVELFSRGIIISSAAAAVGGALILSIPLPEIYDLSKDRLKLGEIVPHKSIMLYGLIMLSLMGLYYSATLPVGLLKSIPLRVIPWVFYVIALLAAGKWYDNNGSFIVAAASFTLVGIGFIVWTLSSRIPAYILLSQVLALSGLACSNVYLWASLTDNPSIKYPPLYFAVGMTARMISMAGTIAIVQMLGFDPLSHNRVIGVAGAALVFAGMFPLLYYNLIYGKPDGTALDLRDTHNVPWEHILGVRIKHLLVNTYELTNRETEVACLLLKGYSNRQISKLLFISENTVKYHVGNILGKVGVSKRQDMCQIVSDSIERSGVR